MGLIGTSIVHAAKYRNLPVTFAAFDNNPDVRAEAAELLPHIKITTTLQQAVENAELVILAVPVGVMEQVIKDIAPYLRPGCVITDTGSTKRSVIRDVLPFVPEACNFIPGHPLAGTEFSGPAACLLYTSPSPRDDGVSRMPSSA